MSKKNATVIEGTRNVLLLSYNTPVAYYDKQENCLFITVKKWSNTTSKHINAFRRECLPICGSIQEVPQEEIEAKFQISARSL